MSKPKTDIFYPFYVGDYRKDTARLSCEQHGAYRQLIDEYWVSGPLPDSDELLARICGLEVRVWRKHRPVIMAYFRLKAGVWRHKRIDAELKRAGERKAKAKASAEARWGKRDANAMLGASSEHCSEECSGDALHTHLHQGSAYPSQEVTEVGFPTAPQVVPLHTRGRR